MKTKLKPCPFPNCQGECKILKMDGDIKTRIVDAMIKCDKCQTIFLFRAIGEEEIIKKWNTRHPELPDEGKQVFSNYVQEHRMLAAAQKRVDITKLSEDKTDDYYEGLFLGFRYCWEWMKEQIKNQTK